MEEEGQGLVLIGYIDIGYLVTYVSVYIYIYVMIYLYRYLQYVYIYIRYMRMLILNDKPLFLFEYLDSIYMISILNWNSEVNQRKVS